MVKEGNFDDTADYFLPGPVSLLPTSCSHAASTFLGFPQELPSGFYQEVLTNKSTVGVKRLPSTTAWRSDLVLDMLGSQTLLGEMVTSPQ